VPSRVEAEYFVTCNHNKLAPLPTGLVDGYHTSSKRISLSHRGLGRNHSKVLLSTIIDKSISKQNESLTILELRDNNLGDDNI
jgi:hypothetical protein